MTTRHFKRFADWCQHKNDLSQEARHTVEVLLKFAGTSNPNKADRVLSSCAELNLNNNQISDITPLSSLTHLTKLNLNKNQISDITPLSGLTHLTNLYLSNNQITNIAPVSGLTQMRYLSLDKNQISDITPLSDLTRLTTLYLEDNQISDITPLSGLTNLTCLYLCFNRINNITPVSGLTNLIKLEAFGNNPIFNLNLLRTLQQQWRNLSTEPIAHQQATVAVKSAYAIIGFAEPEIIFCSSPYAALTSVDRYNLVSVDGYRLWLSPLERELFKAMRKSLNSPLWSYLYVEIPFRAGREVERQLEQQLKHDGMKLKSYMTSEALLRSISTTEFFISEYSFVLKDEEQEALQCLKQLFSSCGWLFPFEKVCIVCDRPRILSFDNQERLHAEGSPAIQFADGWSVYAYHGVRLLEKYGKVHPNQWQAQWLLEEKNAELRRVLIQGIGYDRICQELQAIELDSWQEYTLIQIDSDVDVEPIYLLKMTCPSTGYIHALRVPPDMKSAREAIFWVNWGVDPEEFSVQT